MILSCLAFAGSPVYFWFGNCRKTVWLWLKIWALTFPERNNLKHHWNMWNSPENHLKLKASMSSNTILLCSHSGIEISCEQHIPPEHPKNVFVPQKFPQKIDKFVVFSFPSSFWNLIFLNSILSFQLQTTSCQQDWLVCCVMFSPVVFCRNLFGSRSLPWIVEMSSG